MTLGDRLDRVLTHRLWGTVVFLLMMVLVFQAVFSWASYPQDLIDAGIGVVASTGRRPAWPTGALRSLLVDGLIGGVGGVIGFLPQIFILFFFIAVLEDCGYMARAAYLMDKLMVRVGLSGKSFIPLLVVVRLRHSRASWPRASIENRRDRLTTILIAPLMSCSARLPVYALLIAAFIPAASTWLADWLSFAGRDADGDVPDRHRHGRGRGRADAEEDAVARADAAVRHGTAELQVAGALRSCMHRMLERGWSFVRRAGTLIVAVAIVVWASLYYPHDAVGRGAVFGRAGERSKPSLDRPCRCSRRARTNRRHNSAIWTTRLPAPISGKASWAGSGAGSSRPCARWAGTGGSAARRSHHFRHAKSSWPRWASSTI